MMTEEVFDVALETGDTECVIIGEPSLAQVSISMISLLKYSPTSLIQHSKGQQNCAGLQKMSDYQRTSII